MCYILPVLQITGAGLFGQTCLSYLQYLDNTWGLNDTTCENVFVIVGVDEPAGAEHTIVYPNPAIDQITVEGLPASNNIESIRLVNTLGGMIFLRPECR